MQSFNDEPAKETKGDTEYFIEMLLGTDDTNVIRSKCAAERIAVRQKYGLPRYSLYENPTDYVTDLIKLANGKGYRVEKDLDSSHPAYVPSAQGYLDHRKRCISLPPNSFEDPARLFAQIKDLEHEVIHVLNGTKMEAPYRTKSNTTALDVARYEFEASIGSQITEPIIAGDEEMLWWFLSFVRHSVEAKCKELDINMPWKARRP